MLDGDRLSGSLIKSYGEVVAAVSQRTPEIDDDSLSGPVAGRESSASKAIRFLQRHAQPEAGETYPFDDLGVERSLALSLLLLQCLSQETCGKEYN